MITGLYHFLISATRKVITKYHIPRYVKEEMAMVEDCELASNIIMEMLRSNKPCMIARFGSTELDTIVKYRGMQYYKGDIVNCILGETPKWWWRKHEYERIKNLSGFINPNEENLIKFSKMMIEDMRSVDVLGSWRKEEYFFKEELKNATKVKLDFLEPFWSMKPWTKILENKKILVVHPFVDTIVSQYKKRHDIFPDKEILPRFKELYTIKAVQSIGGECEFKDWFEALNYMKCEIDKYDYDICLLGCGAYGFPLAAHVKRMGRKAIHLGGALQLLFGIAGKRWTDPNGRHYNTYKDIINENWVYPSILETPRTANDVENGCYWK